ncbi:MAG TPA: YdeI/OmpD-associated family protein [Bacteroidota bacterium]
MNITKTLYVTTRAEWRRWLGKNHSSAKEIWLIFYRKASGKKRIPYNDAVEEALCYGWIDSISKGIDGSKWGQRFTPRRRRSFWSEMNKERVQRLIRKGKMTRAGLLAFHGNGNIAKGAPARWTIPPDILRSLKKNPQVWTNFRKFSPPYQRIRVGWIDAARKRPEIFRQRLRYFIRMTERGKQYGMVQ